MRYRCNTPLNPLLLEGKQIPLHPPFPKGDKTSRESGGGFTLIEIIVVLFLVGLSAGLVAMSVARTKERTVLEKEARKLHRVMGYARELSLMQRAPFALVPDPEAGAYWLEKDGAAYGKPYKVPEGMVLYGKPIVFLPKGNSRGGSVSVTDSTKRRGYIVKVDPATGVAAIFRLQPA